MEKKKKNVRGTPPYEVIPQQWIDMHQHPLESSEME